MIGFAAVLHSPEIVMPWLGEKVSVVSCHSFDMHRQGFDFLVMAHEALQVQYSDCGPLPILLEVFLGEEMGTLKKLYLFSTKQATRQLEKSKNHHYADPAKASEMLIEFGD